MLNLKQTKIKKNRNVFETTWQEEISLGMGRSCGFDFRFGYTPPFCHFLQRVVVVSSLSYPSDKTKDPGHERSLSLSLSLSLSPSLSLSQSFRF